MHSNMSQHKLLQQRTALQSTFQADPLKTLYFAQMHIAVPTTQAVYHFSNFTKSFSMVAFSALPMAK